MIFIYKQSTNKLIRLSSLLVAQIGFTETKEEYIKEEQFDLIMQTGIKHKPNKELRASQS